MSDPMTTRAIYKFEETSADKQWDDFVLSSPEGTIYSTSSFLQACPVVPRIWFCKKGAEKKAAVVVFEDSSSHRCIIPPHFVYGGILFAPDFSQQKPDRINDQFAITKATIEHLDRNYTEICLTTSPDYIDIRPFLWHNYGEENYTPRIEVRYTSRLDLDLFANPEAMLASMGASRRRSIRRGMCEDLVVEEFFDLDEFELLYLQTFKRQGITVSPEDLRFLRFVLPQLKQRGLVEMHVVREPNGKLANIGVFSLFGTTVTYLYGASSDSADSAHTGSILFWQVCQKYFHKGYRRFDFDGVNSPKRGYFKLSFGGSLEPYFRISWKSKTAAF